MEVRLRVDASLWLSVWPTRIEQTVWISAFLHSENDGLNIFLNGLPIPSFCLTLSELALE